MTLAGDVAVLDFIFTCVMLVACGLPLRAVVRITSALDALKRYLLFCLYSQPHFSDLK